MLCINKTNLNEKGKICFREISRAFNGAFISPLGSYAGFMIPERKISDNKNLCITDWTKVFSVVITSGMPLLIETVSLPPETSSGNKIITKTLLRNAMLPRK